MTYTEAENYLLSLSNIPRQEYMSDPKACATYLKRMEYFLSLIGNPHKQIPHYIHVTGTSGKGSVTTFLHSILTKAYGANAVGSTISPHPTTLTERWRVGNTHMSKKEFVEIVAYLKPCLEEYLRKSPHDMLSYFDLTTIIAFVYFAKKKVTWAVVEVGCGGRYDSTNVIPNPDITVITNVGLDHTEILGDTKEKIAYEKAGIIKKGSLVFTGDKEPNVLDIISQECYKNKARGLHIIPNGTHTTATTTLAGTSFIYNNTSYHLRTLGVHQIHNAILCIEIAKALNISDSEIQKGLALAEQPLRMQVVSTKPIVILDGAHNADKIMSTARTVAELNQQEKRAIHLVVGFSENKDLATMITSLAALKPASVYCTRNTSNPFRKAAHPRDIARAFKKKLPKTKVEMFLDPQDAVEQAMTHAKKDAMILVTGSIFLSGELIPFVHAKKQ